MSDQSPHGAPSSGYATARSGSQRDGSRYEAGRGSGQKDRTMPHGSVNNQDRQEGRHSQRPPSHHPHQGHTLPPPPIRLIPGQPPPFLGPPFQHQQFQQPPPYRNHPQQQHGSHYHPHDRPHHPGHHSQEQQLHHANHFPLYPLDRFKVKCAAFRQPVEIGSFSYDEKRNFVMDDSQLVRKESKIWISTSSTSTRDYLHMNSIYLLASFLEILLSSGLDKTK